VRVLIADDEAAARLGMKKALQQIDCDVTEVADGLAAVAAIREGRPDLVFLDLDMPQLDGAGVLAELGAEAARTEIVVVTADDALGTAVACMRAGAADFIVKPFEVEQLRAIARRAARRLALETQVASLREQLDQKSAFGSLVGVSRPMRELYDQIERAAVAPLPVLLTGETGTGKELIAREIHARSPRAKGPFEAVNASAVSATLAESELFGHVKGAFTGADREHRGVFARASGGTLFLDEIGDMPEALQAKVLRALQEGVVQPVGASAPLPVDVRVISATHQDLAGAIEAGTFRQDLFYRLKGVRLRVPPLRERREDIPLLADYFLERLGEKAGRPMPRLGPDAVTRLLAHGWPGNVRELEQVVTAAAAMARGDVVGAAELDLGESAAAAASLDAFFDLPLSDGKAKLVEWYEREAIQAALAATGGNITQAAKRLGVHRQSLQQKMQQLGLRGS
jgi:DNA-binding NtrC family response regulator